MISWWVFDVHALSLVLNSVSPGPRILDVQICPKSWFLSINFCSRCFACYLSYMQFYLFCLKLKEQNDAVLLIIRAKKIDSSVISVWLVFMIMGGVVTFTLTINSHGLSSLNQIKLLWINAMWIHMDSFYLSLFVFIFIFFLFQKIWILMFF